MYFRCCSRSKSSGGMAGFKRYIKALLDLFFPRKCIVCGRKLNVSEEHLCLYCLSDLPLTRFWTLNHNPMSDAFNAALQQDIRDNQPREHYAFATALFFYESEAEYRHIPYQIKYRLLRGNQRHKQHHPVLQRFRRG